MRQSSNLLLVPLKEIEGVVIDRHEDTFEAITVNDLKLSADQGARWLKKGKRSFFGYKGFLVTDTIHWAIHKVLVTPAHVSEVKSLEQALGQLKPHRLYADKGYASEKNRAYLKSH